MIAVSFVRLFIGLLTSTFPSNSLDAAETAWTGSLSWLSLSIVGYKFAKFCLYLESENSETVGDIFPIKQVK